MDEVWQSILGFPDYLISNHGRVYSSKTDTILKARPSGWGYLQVMLSDGHNRQTTKSIHIMVAETFVPGWDESLEPNHKDGNKANNHESNLEWETKKGNNKHAIDTGLRTPRHTRVRIKETGEEFYSVKDCAEHLNTYPTAVSAVLTGKRPHYKNLHFEYV